MHGTRSQSWIKEVKLPLPPKKNKIKHSTVIGLNPGERYRSTGPLVIIIITVSSLLLQKTFFVSQTEQ